MPKSVLYSDFTLFFSYEIDKSETKLLSILLISDEATYCLTDISYPGLFVLLLVTFFEVLYILDQLVFGFYHHV